MPDGQHDALEQLGGREARVREASVMVATDGPLSEEKLREVAENARRQLPKLGWSQQLLAQKAATNETYVSEFLNGRLDKVPAAALQNLARSVNEAIELGHKRKAQDVRASFVNTLVAERLTKGLRIISLNRDVGVFHGPAGVGKTTTLLEFQRQNPSSIYVYVDPDAARPAGLRRAIYARVWEHRSPTRVTLHDLLTRLQYSDRLLMFDSADVLEPACFPVLMALHDVARVPIALVGTHRLIAKLTADADPLRGQMASRIGMRVELLKEKTSPKSGGRRGDWISAAQLRAMFETGRLRLHPSATVLLKAIANTEIGALRRVERILRYAVMAAESRGEITIDAEKLHSAISLVDGEPSLVSAELEAELATAAG